MKADIKAQWIADLRSGEFEQGTSYLERVDPDGRHELCCLGVLCRQAVKAGVIPEPELRDDGAYCYLDDDRDDYGKVTGEVFNEYSSLPRKVAEWAGLPKHANGDMAEDVILTDELSAIGANDAAGMSFAQIADLIEQNVPVTG